jgi:hypothetical protein
MSKFLRCFCYGLEPGETVLTSVEGQPVVFTYETPQVDVPVTPSADPSPVPVPVNPD